MSGDRVHVICFSSSCPHATIAEVHVTAMEALLAAGLMPDDTVPERRDNGVWEYHYVYKKRPAARAAKAILKNVHGVAFGYVGGMIA